VPLGLASGTGRHQGSLFATNGDLNGIPPEARLPGVVEVNLGSRPMGRGGFEPPRDGL
jgi:hypothetical protein